MRSFMPKIIAAASIFAAIPLSSAYAVHRHHRAEVDTMSTASVPADPEARAAMEQLLAELPSTINGLGATESGLLDLIARGHNRTKELFQPGGLLDTHVFDQWELGPLLEGLGSGPMPAITGLDPKLATLAPHDARGRNAAYRRSRLSLTEFGKAVLEGREDFRRHNPIRRWWGGTLLTNERLWRWDGQRRVLVAP